VLLPKRENAECIGDYRPVSLVHNIAKIFSKILASRLAPRLGEMVSSSQSALSKKMHPRQFCLGTRHHQGST
jgi:hypothetical protein